jgi:hypothetical protein
MGLGSGGAICPRGRHSAARSPAPHPPEMVLAEPLPLGEIPHRGLCPDAPFWDPGDPAVAHETTRQGADRTKRSGVPGEKSDTGNRVEPGAEPGPSWTRKEKSGAPATTRDGLCVEPPPC